MNISVIGLGYVGLPFAIAVSRSIKKKLIQRYMELTIIKI